MPQAQLVIQWTQIWKVIMTAILQLFISRSVHSCMDLSSTIALFSVIAAFLMILFCLILRYYSKKLKRQQLTARVGEEMVQELMYSTQEITQGAYEQFKSKQRLKCDVQLKELHLEQSSLIKQTDIRQTLNISNNIYGMTKLRKRLNEQTPSFQNNSYRDIISLKSFNISRLDTAESNKERSFYSYVKKIVAYNANGLQIIENIGQYIKRSYGTFEIIKQIQQSRIDVSNKTFKDQLEIYGFNYGSFGFYKFQDKVDISDFKAQESLKLKNMRIDSSKCAINKDEYFQIRAQMIRL